MPASKHEIEVAARKHAILAGHQVEKALRQLSGYPGRPPALMQAERDLLDVRRFWVGSMEL